MNSVSLRSTKYSQDRLLNLLAYTPHKWIDVVAIGRVSDARGLYRRGLIYMERGSAQISPVGLSYLKRM